MDLERSEICYLSLRRDSRTDIIELQQVGASRFPEVTITINILVSDARRSSADVKSIYVCFKLLSCEEDEESRNVLKVF